LSSYVSSSYPHKAVLQWYSASQTSQGVSVISAKMVF